MAMEHETMTDTPKHEIVDLPVKDISYDPAKRLRKVDPNKVAELNKSIAEFGLLEPIGVTRAEEEGKYLLRYGAHRFEVVKELKWKNVTSNILDLGSTAACIAEIDENLMITVLTPTQRSDHIAKRKVLYELLHPETKKGNAQAAGMRRTAKLQSAAPDSQVGSEVVEDPPKQPSFVEDTAAQTGLSPTTIARDVERSTKVTEVAKMQIEGTPLDTGKVLDELKQLPPDQQLPRVQELMEERKQPKKPRQSKQPSKSEMVQDWLPSRLKVGERGITQEDINEAWMRALDKAWKPVRELWKGEFSDALRRKFVLKVEHDLEQNGLSEKIWRKREERDAKFEAAVERHRAAEEARADAGAERVAPAAEARAGKKVTPEEEQAPAHHNAKMAERAA
jgi:ParB family chromosome partitioning protein